MLSASYKFSKEDAEKETKLRYIIYILHKKPNFNVSDTYIYMCVCVCINIRYI